MPYCPACDDIFADLSGLRDHLQKAQANGDPNHVDIIALEGWNETSSGAPETTGNIPPKEIT